MTLAVWIIAAILALLLQSKLSLFECPVNLAVAVVYAFGINSAMMKHSAATGSADVSAEMKATFFGAVVGLIEDGMTGSIIGPNVLSKGLVGFISSFVFRDIFFLWESSLGGIVLCLLTMVDVSIALGVRLLFSNIVTGGRAVVELIIIQAIMNIPIGLLVKPGQKDTASEQIWFRKRKYN
ncbi:MAG: hypothetical protein ACLPN1_11630 [Dissulfurispiraceae bacterium]